MLWLPWDGVCEEWGALWKWTLSNLWPGAGFALQDVALLVTVEIHGFVVRDFVQGSVVATLGAFRRFGDISGGDQVGNTERVACFESILIGMGDHRFMDRGHVDQASAVGTLRPPEQAAEDKRRQQQDHQ